jgi:hypothetical protein
MKLAPTVRQRFARAALVLALVDLVAVVVSGGVSVLGSVEASGFALRAALVAFLLAADFASRGRPRPTYGYAYLALLLALVPILHFRGYRLRGDGLWYYSFAHSLAFDLDIDLTNQYRSLGIDHQRGSQPVRETGLARFTYPVGAPILWVPFVELGHLGAALRNAHGLPTRYDGFSDPYFHAVALGNLLYGFFGFLVLDRLLRKWFPPWASFLAVVGVGLGSFLAFYLTYHAIYTHALTFLLIAFFVNGWVKEEKTRRDYGVLGLVLGIATLVRWQNAVFGLLPALDLLARLRRREWRIVGQSSAAFGAAFFLGVLPQLLSWKAIFDRLYIGVPLGPDYVRWDDPYLSEILFSSRHGLFSWSPILLVAVLGLAGFVRAHPRRGVPLAAVALLVWYVNATVADWWGGGSYGARRFDSALPILALGLGTAVAFAAELVRRHPRAVTAGAVAAAIAANALLMEQYRKGRIPVDDTMSWQAATEAGLEDGFDAFGYPFSFPMNWIFAARYDRPKTQYDILVGKYLFHRMGGLDGVIDLGLTDPPFVGNGWSGLRDWKERPQEVRLASGEGASLFIPLFRPEPLRILIDCAVPEGVEPSPIEIRLNGTRLKAFVPTTEMAEQVMTAERALWRRINLLEVVPLSPAAGPVLAVDRFRFERLEP